MSEMKHIRVKLDRQNDAYHFRATNIHGHTVDIDNSGAYDDHNGSGAGPMEMVLMAIGGCSAFDIVNILTRGRQHVESFGVEVDGSKPADETPSPYRQIEIHYDLHGEITEDRARRAIDLSLDKYCSVSAMLEKAAVISYSFSVNGERFEGRTVNPSE